MGALIIQKVRAMPIIQRKMW